MTDADQPPLTRTEGDGETLDLPEGMQGFAKGQILGERYQIVELLGRGGMGEVWRAFDLKLRVEVALKALRPEFFKSDRRLELLRQEVRAAREVMSPNVCRIFDLVEVEGRELVSMEYVDGATLLGVLHERGPLELKEAQDIASQFLAGLEAIHKAGLIHRDIKPENIMVTRAGRVVVMDFGLAREEAEGGGSVSGTPAYMSPEQAAGQTLDARADVYAAGVVLAEMVSPDGIKSFESRQSVWEGVRSEPAKVPDTPWAPVIQQAVKKDREGRFNSAHTLTRALEDVTLRVEGADDLHPYPGLASFTEDDAEYFFGREAEVEQMWRKLEGAPRMLGLVGPSGAGKSSFIRAGLFAASPMSWSYAVCTPGNAAISSLGRVMAREMAGDPDMVERMMDFNDPDVAVEVLSRWRERTESALLVVDQFEELFTQNSPEEQHPFTSLLNRIVLEADVCVVLSMRDDFLMRCREFEALEPVFADLTALPALSGHALRRALVRPATKCGYRFENDAFVEEMLSEVEGERGALPLLAFAAARLWERRDREAGILTREAYHEIGGVGGALAQHAEATIDRIGTERIPVIRELFRNLVTAEGTRAVREWGELLSIFDEAQRESAAGVLRELVDARLLTSYEVHEDEHEPTRRVEIIHESLLANWPRLVRWQTQDQEGAQLRDELRQAARSWDEHGQHDDRLWTGTAFREYRLWRERYRGGLTETEEAFARAMTWLATRRRRHQRMAVAASFTFLLVVLAVVGSLWQRSVLETRRAEASKLLALGELEFGSYPTAALAWATASVELADTLEGRLLALRALQEGPPVTVLPAESMSGQEFSGARFSPSGEWLVSGGRGQLHLWNQNGEKPRGFAEFDLRTEWVGYGFESDNALITDDAGTHQWWSVNDVTAPRQTKHDRGFFRALKGNGYLSYQGSDQSEWINWWPLDQGPPQFVGSMEPWDWWNDAIDSNGSWLAYKPMADEKHLYLRSLENWDRPPRRLGGFDGRIRRIAFHPDGELVAALDTSGEVKIFQTTGTSPEPIRTMKAASWSLLFDPAGTWLATTAVKNEGNALWLWDLGAPQGTFPLKLSRSEHASAIAWSFHPSGDWLVSGSTESPGLWPLKHRYPWVLGHGGRVVDLAITPDGRWMLSLTSEGEGELQAGQVRAWPLAGQNGGISKVLLERPRLDFYGCRLAIQPSGKHVAVSTQTDSVHVVPLEGGRPRKLVNPQGSVSFMDLLAFSPDGRTLAAVPITNRAGEMAVRVWDLESGAGRVVGKVAGFSDHLGFMDQNRLLWSGHAYQSDGGGEMVFHLDDGTVELRSESGSEIARVVSPSGASMLTAEQTGPDTTEIHWSNIETGEVHPITLHGDGNKFRTGTIDRLDRWLVTGATDGTVRIGPVSGEEPFILYGHEGLVSAVAFSADGSWIASGGDDRTVRLWPMPDLSKPPLHTLPNDELIANLKTLTNLRVVRDEESPTGWRLTHDPFPGWETVPEW